MIAKENASTAKYWNRFTREYRGSLFVFRCSVFFVRCSLFVVRRSLLVFRDPFFVIRFPFFISRFSTQFPYFRFFQLSVLGTRHLPRRLAKI